MRRLLRRASEEAGYSMAVVIIVMLACGGFVAAGYAATQNDAKTSADSRERKAALAAAEAGLNYYVSRLNQDPDYWTNCTNVPKPSATEDSPVNNVWTTGADTRKWRTLPGSKAKYTIELLPATGYANCQEDVNESMIDPTTASFRIRATGRSGRVSRSLIGTFKRKTFLHFLYFTDFETKDPIAYDEDVDGNGETPTWAASNCGDRYRPARNKNCTEIQFRTGDEIKGPFHTNDSVWTCDKPSFGRAGHVPVDTFETTLENPSYIRVCSAVDPVINGQHLPGAGKMTLPTSNASLKDLATAGYTFTGKTSIELTGTNMKVTNSSGTTTTKALPADGVVYVKNGAGCSGVATPYHTTYAETAGCGNVWVWGTYSKSLTIAAANDVIVGKPGSDGNGGVQKTNDSVLGLIAENFVRVYHKVNWSGDSCPSNVEAMTNVRIDAAILALKHSFAVDNAGCGTALGKLTVNGAIAQKYRGVVGTSSNGALKSGYLKDYNYDDRLRYRSPPQFLPPVEAQWIVVRQTEQLPARI